MRLHHFKYKKKVSYFENHLSLSPHLSHTPTQQSVNPHIDPNGRKTTFSSQPRKSSHLLTWSGSRFWYKHRHKCRPRSLFLAFPSPNFLTCARGEENSHISKLGLHQIAVTLVATFHWCWPVSSKSSRRGNHYYYCCCRRKKTSFGYRFFTFWSEGKNVDFRVKIVRISGEKWVSIEVRALLMAEVNGKVEN